MGKHDHPSLQFKVDGGRLAPAGPYEQEVLSTYQRGSEITVTLHQRRSLPLLKKYWAVLRDVVENCKTPWASPDEASDALKLALGVTDIGKTVKGQWFIRAGSISFASMDQAAFRNFFEKAMALLAEVTGIDPDSLRDRYSHLAETDTQSPDAPSSASDDSGGEPSSLPAATDPQESGDKAGADDIGESDQAPAEPIDGATRELMRECLDKMLGVATDNAVPDPKERRGVLERVKDAWKPELPDHLPFVKACFESADRVIKGGDAKSERKYLEGLIGRAA